MATPYLQLRVEEVPSTQDRARAELGRLPVVVIAQRQTEGRGRGGASWLSATRALAVSLAFRPEDSDRRPFSLMAGVAAARVVDMTLKWPNDLMRNDAKLGGILVEQAEEVVVGMGLNLWWPNAPAGTGALHREDPGPELHAEIAGLWAAEVMLLLDGEGWPLDEYRTRCSTLGEEITWDPERRGTAIDIADTGALVVQTGNGVEELVSGAIRHVRTLDPS